MRKLVLCMILGMLFSACETAIPVVDPTALDDRNIYVRAYKYFNGDLIDTSKVFEINGDIIKIDHIYITLSSAEFVSDDYQDTTRTENDLTMIDLLTTSEVKLAQLSSGSYNGRLNYRIGLDSARAHTSPENLEESNPLGSGVLWNGPDLGHSFFQMEGRVFDALDTVFTSPKSTFTWRITSQDMVIERSEKRNFSVGSNLDVFFVINLDVDKLFLGLQPSQMPEIYSDPASSADIGLANILKNNLESEFIFKL